MTRLDSPQIRRALQPSIVDILSARGFCPATHSEHGREVLYRCPLPDHYDRNPSFTVNTEKNLWKCFGCDRGGDATDLIRLLEQGDDEFAELTPLPSLKPTVGQSPQGSELVDSVFDLGPLVPQVAPLPVSAQPGCTLEEVAEAKGLPVEHLRACGWSDIPRHTDGPAVRIPYQDADGREGPVRYRCALTGDHRFRWQKGTKPLLYGLGRLTEAQRAGHIIVVEGETDTATLWYHGFPAIGVPGAATWKDAWAAKLGKVKTIYLVVEPDSGGERLLETLSNSILRDRLRIIPMPKETKDMNALHLADPAAFRPQVKALMESAQSLYDLDTQVGAAELAEAEALCRDLIVQKDILAPFAHTVHELGVAGEDEVVMLLYLTLTSRYLAKPVPVIMKGVSSSGKSYLVEQVCRFFPDSAYYTLSAASEHALIRTKESFKHRFIIICEAEGISGNFLQYLLRTLISEGRIKYLTLVETEKGWEEMTFEKEGPTGVIVTTTRVTLHPENETRMFSIPTDDSPEQTARVFVAIAEQEERDQSGDEELLAPWLALQTVLGAGPRKVYIPYLRFFSHSVDPSATRLRRDFTNLLTLIRANALLHQRNRVIDPRGRIVACFDDYEQVYQLVRELMEEGAQASVPAKVREVVQAVAKLSTTSDESVTVPRLATAMKLDQSTVRRRLQQALQYGFLQNKADKGKPYRVSLGDEMPEDREILPTPEDLRDWMWPGDDEPNSGARASETTEETPLPPLSDEELRIRERCEQMKADSGYTDEELYFLEVHLLGPYNDVEALNYSIMYPNFKYLLSQEIDVDQ